MDKDLSTMQGSCDRHLVHVHCTCIYVCSFPPYLTVSYTSLHPMLSFTFFIHSSLPLPLSGAVYRGEWAGGIKEGRGTFTFKNGETFSGVFHRDRMASQEESAEVTLRPQTPLGSLIGTHSMLPD